MNDGIWTDAAVGETRQILVRDGRPTALSVWRWSDEGRRAQWGETYRARVRTVDHRRRGAFLDLGLAEAGFVRLNARGEVRVGDASVRLVEGQALTVCVRREGVRDKSPVVEAIAATPSSDAPGRLERHASVADADAAGPAAPDVREAIDALIDDALAPTAPVPNGGMLTIEPTAALVAIDVDAADRSGPTHAEQFAISLNVDAASEVVRQLRLRSLGGIVAVDFVSMATARGRVAVLGALKSAGAGDPWGLQVGPLSRFGVVEMSRGQLRAPLGELLCHADGRLTVETAALAALRGIERESRTARGRLVVAHVASDLMTWLDAEKIPWRSALSARIGPRWEVRADGGKGPGAWQVEAV